MSLLRDIQNAAIDATVDITVVLRKCKLLAARLGNKEFDEWVERELNGYKDEAHLPEYRIFPVSSKGYFIGAFGRQLKNADMPITCLPEELRDTYTHFRARDAISAYTALLNDPENTGNFTANWMPEVVAMVGREIYSDMNCLSAWRVIPRNSFAALVDSVRNRILSFVIQIEAENPEAGEALLNSNPVPQERIAQVFNTFISGDVQNVAAGGTQFSQSASFKVIKNDLESLISYLVSIGINSEDAQDLRTAIQEDNATNASKNTFGNHVSLWVGKMMSKASGGVWKISISAAGTLLGKALSTYFGLP